MPILFQPTLLPTRAKSVLFGAERRAAGNTATDNSSPDTPMDDPPQDRVDFSHSMQRTEQRRLEDKIKAHARKILLQNLHLGFTFKALHEMKQGSINLLLREENGGNLISDERLKALMRETMNEYRTEQAAAPQPSLPKGIKRPFHE